MAGVASGLALATTLMAMQVADSMSVRTCAPYRVVAADVQTAAEPGHGFLGIRYVFRPGAGAVIESVLAGTPAEQNQLRAGDRVTEINGVDISSGADLQERIYNAQPGAQVELTVSRPNGETIYVRPTLASWPVISY
jgi:S1-C subfamily serine protease